MKINQLSISSVRVLFAKASPCINIKDGVIVFTDLMQTPIIKISTTGN